MDCHIQHSPHQSVLMTDDLRLTCGGMVIEHEGARVASFKAKPEFATFVKVLFGGRARVGFLAHHEQSAPVYVKGPGNKTVFLGEKPLFQGRQTLTVLEPVSEYADYELALLLVLETSKQRLD